MKRANWIPAPHYYNLNAACCVVTEAFGDNPYLVGSALERRDYRDVDIRLILADEEFDVRFPTAAKLGTYSYDPLWSLVCSSIALWLSQQSGLPVDFQIQRRTQANAEDGGKPRHPIGLWLRPNPPDYTLMSRDQVIPGPSVPSNSTTLSPDDPPLCSEQ